VTLALGSRPRQGFARLRTKKEVGSRTTYSQECEKVWRNEPSHPKGVPLWELESRWTPEYWDSRIFRGQLQGSKLNGSPEIYYKGEGGGFSQVRAVVSLVCSCCPWLVLAPKVLQLCTNHLALVLCRSVWVDKACQLFLVPSQSSNTPLCPSKVLRAKEHARLLTLPLFSIWESHLSPSRSWECVTMELKLGHGEPLNLHSFFIYV
jgi:hypothetical protein